MTVLQSRKTSEKSNIRINLDNLHKQRESEQEKMILSEINACLDKKMQELEETRLIEKNEESRKLKEMEQEKMVLEELYKYLTSDMNSSDRTVETFSETLKNAIVPTKVYIDLLLEGHFGNLNEKQKEKLKMIKESTSLFAEKISNGLNSKILCEILKDDKMINSQVILLTKENKIAVVNCIEVTLMRRGNANFNLVRSKLENLYNYDIGDCINHLEYLRTVLKEVYKQDYNSMLEDITWELERLEILQINDFKAEFCKIMTS